MKDYQIRPLQMSDMPQMHRSFLEAFSGYPVPMQLSYQVFEKRMLNKLKIKFDLSFGAFSGEKLVGFIFHSENQYKGVTTIYNGGTGVISGHRGHRLSLQLYSAFRNSAQAKAERCVLEAITSNDVAITIYEQIGFRKIGLYHCFKTSSPPDDRPLTSDNLLLQEGSFSHRASYASLDTFETSFSDIFDQIAHNLSSENILECRHDESIVGYIIFQQESGRISRMAVHPSYRRRGIGTFLLREAFKLSQTKGLTVINVPEYATEVIGFLLSVGFENQIDQWEMELKL